MQFVSVTEFLEYVQQRGYKAEPLLNTTEASQTGCDLRITAYLLRGPRGNKTIVIKDEDGLLPLFSAKLWADGVDYATTKVRRRAL